MLKKKERGNSVKKTKQTATAERITVRALIDGAYSLPGELDKKKSF